MNALRRSALVLLASPMLLPAQDAAAPMAFPEEATPTPAMERSIPPGEEKIRVGIILLVQLHDTLAGVRDKDSAEAAVAPVMRTMTKLQEWGQSFNSMPPLDDETRDLYERRYLPTIKKINDRLRKQGERLASAEFYGSRNLPAALVQLVSNFQ